MVNRLGTLWQWGLVLLWSTGVMAAELPRPALVPGGIALVPLGQETTRPPEVYYQGHRVLVLRDHGQWLAIVGIPLDAPLGTHILQVRHSPTQEQRYTFTVHAKQYAVQRLTLKNRRLVNLRPADLQRIAREKQRIRAALTHWSAAGPRTLRFAWPVRGVISSPFGLRRYFNGQPRKPHSGLDIAAPRGTPVRAPAAGRVLDVGEYFFNGKSVFLDHGQGLVTMYFHLNRLAVPPGKWVTRGELIGTVGMTGRATGPHLHWGTSLNGVLVDPLLFVPE